jgi:serine protease Do
VDYGVKIFKLKEGGIFKRLGLQENFTIVYINRQRVKDPQDVIEFFNKYKGRVYMVGINSAKREVPLSFYLQ